MVTTSAGNHSQALAYQAGKLGVPVTVFMPCTAPLVKVSSFRPRGGAREVMERLNSSEDFDCLNLDHIRRVEPIFSSFKSHCRHTALITLFGALFTKLKSSNSVDNFQKPLAECHKKSFIFT